MAAKRVKTAKADGRTPEDAAARLSFSAISTYQRCPRQYEWRYIQGERQPPAIALIEGGAHHDAQAANNRQKVGTAKDLHPGEMLDIFESSLTKKAATEGIKTKAQWGDGGKDAIIKREFGMFTAYLTTEAHRVNPASQDDVEKKVTGSVPDGTGGFVNLLGYVDVISAGTGESFHVDYKTSSRMHSVGDVPNSLQLAIYSMLLELEFGGLCTITKAATPRAKLDLVRFGRRSTMWAAHTVVSVAAAIRAGAFPPCDPTSWMCSERFCGYWRLCRGKKRLS